MTDDEARAVRPVRRWRILALVACALFAASVAGFYHPGTGFSSLLIIPQGHEYEIAALRNTPHFEYPPTIAYDGSMYVQLAMDPLLRDPAIDVAMDQPAYRARRILFAWTAWALGLGRPRWILQTYSLQNVLCWFVLAWLLTRWLPLDRPSRFALWIASMFSQGLLMSVRMSLLDGPSLLLIALAIAAAERGRVWVTSIVLALAALGRETNLLALVAFPRPHGWRGWLKIAAAIVIAVLPLLIWQDYLWSIYRGSSVSAGSDHVVWPFVSYADKWRRTLLQVSGHGVVSAAGYTVLVLVALTVQAAFVGVHRVYDDPWWRVAAASTLLMFLVDPSVWDGYPGAITRVVLPLKFGFNILLARRSPRGFWVWFALGNLDVIGSLNQMPIPGVPPPF